MIENFRKETYSGRGELDRMMVIPRTLSIAFLRTSSSGNRDFDSGVGSNEENLSKNPSSKLQHRGVQGLTYLILKKDLAKQYHLE